MTHLRRTTIAVLALAVLATPLGGYTAAALSQDADVAGNCTLIVETPNGAEPSDLVFAQEGTVLTGTVDTPQGNLPLEGKVEGNNITFSVSIDTPDGSVFTVNFVGTVEENKRIGGTLSSDDAEMSAPFTAEKKEEKS